jgi:hypothetical protein
MSSQLSNTVKGLFLKGSIAGLTDVFKVMLMDSDFVFNPDMYLKYADVAVDEVVNGSGYTTGGETLSGAAITINASGDYALLSWNEVAWQATGGVIQASGAIIYDDSTTLAVDGYEKAVVSYIDFGKVETIAATYFLKIQNLYVKFK